MVKEGGGGAEKASSGSEHKRRSSFVPAQDFYSDVGCSDSSPLLPPLIPPATAATRRSLSFTCFSAAGPNRDAENKLKRRTRRGS